MTISTAPQTGGMPSGQIYGAGISQPTVSPVGEALFKVADTYLKTQTNKKIAQRMLEGQIAGQTREGLERVRNQETFLNQIFGKSATLQGAEQGFAKAAVTDKFNDLSGRLVSEELYTRNPEEFSKLLTAELSPLMTTGDPELDLTMMQATSEISNRLINRYNSMHHEYEQNKKIQADTAEIMSKLESVPAIDPNDPDSIIQREKVLGQYFDLIKRISEESQAGLTTVYTQALSELQRGDSTTYDLVSPFFGDEKEFGFNINQVNNLLNAKARLDASNEKTSDRLDPYKRVVVRGMLEDEINGQLFSDINEMRLRFVELTEEPLSREDDTWLSKEVYRNNQLTNDAMVYANLADSRFSVDGISDEVRQRAALLLENSPRSEQEKIESLIRLGLPDEQASLLTNSLNSVLHIGSDIDDQERVNLDAIKMSTPFLMTAVGFRQEGRLDLSQRIVDSLKDDKSRFIMGHAISSMERHPNLKPEDALQRAASTYSRKNEHSDTLKHISTVINSSDVNDEISKFVRSQGREWVFSTNAPFAKRNEVSNHLLTEQVKQEMRRISYEDPGLATRLIENNDVSTLMSIAYARLNTQGDYGNQLLGLTAENWNEGVRDLAIGLDSQGGTLNVPDAELPQPKDVLRWLDSVMNPNRYVAPTESLEARDAIRDDIVDMFGITPEMMNNVSFNKANNSFIFLSENPDNPLTVNYTPLSIEDLALAARETPGYRRWVSNTIRDHSRRVEATPGLSEDDLAVRAGRAIGSAASSVGRGISYVASPVVRGVTRGAKSAYEALESIEPAQDILLDR